MASPTDSAASFRTAQEGSPKDAEAQKPKSGGAINKPSNGPDHDDDTASPYRPVRDIPYQLRDHIRVFLEEKMCMPL